VDDLKDYLRWHLINASAEMLPKKIADADFDFFSRPWPASRNPSRAGAGA
jgi:Predicted metalloendopeptidase